MRSSTATDAWLFTAFAVLMAARSGFVGMATGATTSRYRSMSSSVESSPSKAATDWVSLFTMLRVDSVSTPTRSAGASLDIDENRDESLIVKITKSIHQMLRVATTTCTVTARQRLHRINGSGQGDSMSYEAPVIEEREAIESSLEEIFEIIFGVGGS